MLIGFTGVGVEARGFGGRSGGAREVGRRERRFTRGRIGDVWFLLQRAFIDHFKLAIGIESGVVFSGRTEGKASVAMSEPEGGFAVNALELLEMGERVSEQGEHFMAEVVVEGEEVGLGKKEQLHVRHRLQSELPPRLFILAEKGEINVAEVGAGSVSGEDEVSAGSTLDISGVSTPDEVDAVGLISFEVEVVALAN